MGLYGAVCLVGTEPPCQFADSLLGALLSLSTPVRMSARWALGERGARCQHRSDCGACRPICARG